MKTILNKESRAAIELMVADGIIAKDTAERYFPELKESEDRRIKSDIQYAVRCAYGDNSEQTNKILGWLEKQGEQKRQMPLVKSVSTDFKDRLGTFMQYTSVDLEKEENQQLLDEAAKELLQLAYSDKANEIALASAKTWEESMAILMAANNAYSRGQKGQKPAEWSEEDENRINRLIAYFEDKESFTAEDDVVYANWLKSLKDRVQPQNKWKESLVTADLENSLCDIQDGFSDTSYEYRILGEAIEFIRCTEPKPQWKPSDEQIEALVSAIDVMIDNRGAGDKNTILLSGLYHKLKAL